MPASPSSPLLPSRARPEGAVRVRLVCFPFAGGASVAFRELRYPSAIEVVAAELPGRGRTMGKPFFSSVPRAAEALATAIAGELGDLPFAFYGHSLGAVIAFECARELRRRGGPAPVWIGLGASRAPHLPDRERKLAKLPEPELVAELRRYEGTPEEVLANRELLDLVLPILRADFGLAEEYVHVAEPPLSIPLRTFAGVDDRTVPVDEVAAWAAESTLPLAPITLPGGHFFLRDALATLRERIAEDVLAHVTRT